MATPKVDARFDKLRAIGYTGSTSDMLLAYYLSHGAVTKTQTDAKREWLIALGVTPSSTMDMWFAYLRSLGYTGTIDDMESQFWAGTFATGPELIPNGNFDAGSATWTVNAGWAVAAGLATGTAAATQLRQTPNTSFIAGKTYRVVFTVSARTAGTINFSINGASNTPGTARNANGTYSQDVVALANSASFGMVGNVFTGSIDNISARQVA